MKRLSVISSNITASLYSYWLYSMACYNYFHVFLSFLLSLLSFFVCLRDLGFGGGKGRRGGGGLSVDFGCVLLIRP